MKTKNLFLALSLLVGTNVFAQDIVGKDPFSVQMKKPHDVVLLNHGLASLEELSLIHI